MGFFYYLIVTKLIHACVCVCVQKLHARNREKQT